MLDVEPIGEIPRVIDFYRDRCIFVTGFSGFMGQCLVEKFLWTCPSLKTIYVLLRGKKNLTVEQRLDKLLASDCFERLRNRGDDLKSKLIPIEGDVSLPALGISETDRSRILSDVTIIVHGAASVKFDDPICRALDINTIGTKAVIDLALTIPKLDAFVHISTTYANCDRYEIDEVVYKPKADWKDTIQVREKIDEATLNILGYKYMNHLPNTYVFTKALSEQMLYDHRDRLPLVIYRPAIVTNSMKEPCVGWYENFNGPIGLLVGYATGVVRTSIQRMDNKMDYVPCDLTSRSIVFMTLLRSFQKKDVVPVYNAANKAITLTVQQFKDYAIKIVYNYPMKYMMWKPTNHTTNSYVLYYIYFILFQLIPALFIDLGLKLMGKKTGMIKLQRKIFVAISALRYFLFNKFLFLNKNGYAVELYMHPDDKEELHFALSTSEVDYYQCMEDSLKYLSKKFFKQRPDEYGAVRRNLRVIEVLDVILKGGFAIFTAWFIYSNHLIEKLLWSTYYFLTDFK